MNALSAASLSVNNMLFTVVAASFSTTRQEKKDTLLYYTFIGFRRRKKVKMAWPMVVVNFSLKSIKDNYLVAANILKVENHYWFHPENVSTTVFLLSCNADEANNCQLYISALQMCITAHVIKSKKLALGMEFFHHNVCAGFSPNILLL
jgi:hypothetical protein